MKIDSFENIISLLVAVFLSLAVPGPRGEVTEQPTPPLPPSLSNYLRSSGAANVLYIQMKGFQKQSSAELQIQITRVMGLALTFISSVYQEFSRGIKNAKLTPLPQIDQYCSCCAGGEGRDVDLYLYFKKGSKRNC